MKWPAFLLYVDDFLGGTCDLTPEEVGAYIRLLCHAWSRGGLQNDPAKLSRIAGCPVTPDVISKFFTDPEDGLLKNARQEDERDKQGARSERQSAKGKLSAESRARAKAQAAAQPKDNRGSTPVQPRLNPGSTGWQPDGNRASTGGSTESQPHKPKPNIALSLNASAGDSIEKEAPGSVPFDALTAADAEPQQPQGEAGPPPDDSWPPRAPETPQAPRSDSANPTLDEVLTTASMRGVPPNVAELYWNDREASGWNKAGQPVLKWQPDLWNYWTRYQANEHRTNLQNAKPNSQNRQQSAQRVDRAAGTLNEGFQLPPGSVTTC